MAYDRKVMHRLSYGLYVVTTECDGIINGQIADAVMQINSAPKQTVALSLNNDNYTCELAKKSGKLALSILSVDYQPEMIKTFGLQSGRDVDKFADFAPQISPLLQPYYQGEGFCGWLEGKVISSTEVGSHTIFVIEVENGEVGENDKPLIYADYLAQKNKPAEAKSEEKSEAKSVGGKWRCSICGYEHEGDLPEDFRCPWCGQGREVFVPVE